MMGWKLAPGVGYCLAGDDLVFLDLARDRYFALRGADRAAFERLRSGDPNDSEAMTSLLNRGLLARSDAGNLIDPATIAVPSHDLSAAEEEFSPIAGFGAAKALLWAKRAMRPHRIAATIAELERSKAPKGRRADDDVRIELIAARYAASRWIVPVPPRCLVDALALLHILLRRQYSADLVFGVRTNPFAAHSWVQTSGKVLTGTAAEARNFTPILVV